jgi:O-antigen ligase
MGAAVALASASARSALALLIVATFFPVSFGISGAVIGPPDAAVGLVLAVWVSRMMLERSIVIPRTPGDWTIAALLLAATAATCASALSAGPVPVGASLKKIAQLASFIALYYFVIAQARDRRSLRFAAAIFLGFSALEALYAAFFQFAPGQMGGPGLWPPYLVNRATARAMGTVDASFGHYMAAALVLAISLAAQGPGRTRTLGAITAPALFAGLIASGTRGSTVAAAVGLALVIAFSSRRRIIFAHLAGLSALLIAAALLTPEIASPAKLQFLFTSHGASQVAVRLLSWKIGWQLALAHPWLGLGPGANALTVETLIGVPAEALRYVEGTMNAYLQAFLEMGVIGGAGLLGFILSVSATAVMRRARSNGLALGLGAAVFTLGVTGLTGPLLMGGIGHLLFALAGLAVAAESGPEEPA